MPEFCPIYDSSTSKPIGIWAQFPQNIHIEGLLETEMMQHARSMRNAFASDTTRQVANDETDVGNGVVFMDGAFIMLGNNKAPNEDLRDRKSQATYVLRNHDGVAVLWREGAPKAEPHKTREEGRSGATQSPTNESVLRRLQEAVIRGENLSFSDVREWGDRATIIPLLKWIRDNRRDNPRVVILASTLVDAADDIWAVKKWWQFWK